jgi:hypothetical protein
MFGSVCNNDCSDEVGNLTTLVPEIRVYLYYKLQYWQVKKNIYKHPVYKHLPVYTGIGMYIPRIITITQSNFQ